MGTTERGRLTFLTLPVDDLNRAGEFYHVVFGWAPPRPVGPARFFALPALTLALLPRGAFNEFVNGDSTSRPSVLLSWNVAAQDDVATLVARVVAAGGSVRRPPGAPAWGGWAAVIETPDGHLWEIVWNPRSAA